LPKIIQYKVWLAIEFDSFRGGKLSFVDPIHRLPWPSFFVGYFIDFEVEKYLFGTLYCFAKEFPVFKTLQQSIFLKLTATVIIPPTLGVPHDIGEFCISVSCLVYIIRKFVDNVFQHMNI